MPFWVEEPSPSCLLPTAAPHRDGQRAPSQTCSVKATSQPLGALRPRPRLRSQLSFPPQATTTPISNLAGWYHSVPCCLSLPGWLSGLPAGFPAAPRSLCMLPWAAESLSSSGVHPPCPRAVSHTLSATSSVGQDAAGMAGDQRQPGTTASRAFQGLPGPSWPPLGLVRQLLHSAHHTPFLCTQGPPALICLEGVCLAHSHLSHPRRRHLLRFHRASEAVPPWTTSSSVTWLRARISSVPAPCHNSQCTPSTRGHLF